jgi:hypothetical protein
VIEFDIAVGKANCENILSEALSSAPQTAKVCFESLIGQ